MYKLLTSIMRAGAACALIAALPLAADAQGIGARDVKTYLQRREDGRNVSHFHRFELYYGMTFGSGGVNINDRFRDQSNNNIIAGNTRATTFNYRSASGGGAVYFPLSRLGQQSLLALNLGLYAVGNVWDIGNTSLEAGRVTSYEAKDLFFGVPIGVDFIYGGEATLNKGDKVTLRGGLGLMPYAAMGELADGSQDYAKLGVHPYVKAELGFFAGIEWKVRGMVVAGSRTIYDYKTGDFNLRDSDYYYSFNFKIQPTYTVGLVIFPFSFGWDNDKW
jgi:hypothetical protein